MHTGRAGYQTGDALQAEEWEWRAGVFDVAVDALDVIAVIGGSRVAAVRVLTADGILERLQVGVFLCAGRDWCGD